MNKISCILLFSVLCFNANSQKSIRKLTTTTFEKVNTDFCCSALGENLVNDNSTFLLDDVTIPSAGATYVSGSTLYINGTLTLNGNLTLTGCTVYFTPNAQIVDNGFVLNIEDCDMLSACDAMWKGISSDGGSINITSNSALSHMSEGVKVSNNGILNSTNSNYHNNYISIQLQDLPIGYAGKIENCEFKTMASNLLAPYASLTRARNGIKVIDCREINIGDPANINKKNTFEKLLNGIEIRNSLGGNPMINTSYNTFNDIGGSYSLWYNAPVFLDEVPSLNPNGCAIFGISTNPTSGMQIIHHGKDDISNKDFENCQKAIVCNGISAEIKYNYTHQTEGAFMIYANGQTNIIRENHIDDTYIGIQLSGSTWGAVTGNEILNIKPAYNFSLGPISSYLFYGKGIDWQQFSPGASGGLMINGNEISTQADDFVVGINTSNTSYGFLKNNQVTFQSTSTTPSLSTTPNLIGLSLNRSSGLDITETTVLGTNVLGTDARRTCGIYMQRSPGNYLHCNINDNLQRGITVVGNCEGARMGLPTQINAGIEQNRVTTTQFGWLFRHLTTNGTVGDVGEYDIANAVGIYDANNKFYSSVSTPNLKVFRQFPSGWNCTQQPPVIYTNFSNLQASESSSNNTGLLCKYDVVNGTFLNTSTCNPPINLVPENAGIGMDIAKALEIANNSIDYTEFEDMGENYDERELFAYLVKDTARRLQYPVLNQFYLNHLGSSIEQLNIVDILMAQLIEPSTLENPNLFNTFLANAQLQNSSVTGAEYHVLNEKQINTLQLQALEYGNESLLPSDWEWISELAQECPFVAGNAVYKARMLYSGVNPLAYFDDLKICNSVGVAKNGTGLFDDENAALDSITAQTGGKLVFEIEGNQIKVYPNPATDNVTVSYHLNAFSHAQFQLLDIQGRVLKTIDLLPTVNHVNFSVTELANAIYNYRYIVNGSIIENGKFNKE